MSDIFSFLSPPNSINEGAFRTYTGDRELKSLKSFITEGWKTQKPSGRVPAKVPAWYRFQLELYNKLMISLDQLEVYATEFIHEDPLVAGVVVGLGAALSLLLGYVIISSLLGCIFSRPAPRPKTD